MDTETPTVFIIDDDDLLLQLYSQKAKDYGIDLTSANSAMDALEKLRMGYSPMVLIVDIEMPDMNGFELLEKIREEKLAPDSFVIILTNKSEPAYIQQAEKLSVDQYIIKATFLPSEVMREVLELISKRKQ